MFLLLALACTPDPTDTGADPADTGADTGDSGADTEDTGADTGDTDTGDAVDADGDGTSADLDCDDSDADIFPGATELCDGRDQDCDLVIDEGLPSIGFMADRILGGAPATGGYWFGYDADGLVTLYGRDANEDGVLETYQRREYVGGLLSAEERSDNGVTRSYRAEYDRNADGSISEARVDSDGDGAWNYSYGYWYVDGRYGGYWSDSNHDGVYDAEQRQEYNEDGSLDHYWSDDDGDGVAEVETWYTYADGHLVESTSDGDGDGVFEVLATYTWDGDRILEERVTGGSYPSLRTYSYVDADDRYDQVDYDALADGTLDYRFGYTWDGEWITGQTYDQYGDGVAVTTYVYTFDSEGRMLTSSTSLDGTYTAFAEYEYTDGVTTARRQDVNGDGTWDIVDAYDTGARQLLSQVDWAGDGAMDFVNTWSYDALGRQTGNTEDTLGDGVLETEKALRDDYTCGTL